MSLETIEPRAVFDGNTLTGITVEQKNRAKELIEDCMIAANQATAAYLKRKGIPSFRRILRSPERWQRIVDLAASCGEPLLRSPMRRRWMRFSSNDVRPTRSGFPISHWLSSNSSVEANMCSTREQAARRNISDWP